MPKSFAGARVLCECHQCTNPVAGIKFRGCAPAKRNALYNPAAIPSTTGDDMAEPTYEELKAKIAELEKQGGGRRTGALEFRVGEKGGVSVYGLGRFPVTLYYEQWIRLLETAPQLRAFLEENKAAGKLKLKEK